MLWDNYPAYKSVNCLMTAFEDVKLVAQTKLKRLTGASVNIFLRGGHAFPVSSFLIIFFFFAKVVINNELDAPTEALC